MWSDNELFSRQFAAGEIDRVVGSRSAVRDSSRKEKAFAGFASPSGSAACLYPRSPGLDMGRARSAQPVAEGDDNNRSLRIPARSSHNHLPKAMRRRMASDFPAEHSVQLISRRSGLYGLRPSRTQS